MAKAVRKKTNGKNCGGKHIAQTERKKTNSKHCEGENKWKKKCEAKDRW